MVLLSFKCPKCGKETEEFVKSSSDAPLCKICETKTERLYSGKCYGKIGTCSSSGECTHNCATCPGCGKK